MIIMGVEGSANKLGIGVMRDSEILSNLRETYSPPTGQGFIPLDAAEHHRSKIYDLIERSLEAANIKMSDVDIFCYTRGPGMYQLLSIGCNVFRTLSLLYNKPLIPVNHCIAHIEMGKLVTNAKNPVVLYASGGNTQIIAYSDKVKLYKIFGETLDVAVGNCLDRVARELNLSNYPSPGYSIEQAAKKGSKYIPLPYTVKGMDMSFTGPIETLKRIKHEYSVEDLCYSLQETLFAMLVEVTERAMSYVGSDEVMLVGGVGCNVRLQEMLGKMVKQRGGILYSTDERFCIDNGVMIAYTGYLMHKSGCEFKIKDCNVTQRFRTDSVKVNWN